MAEVRFTTFSAAITATIQGLATDPADTIRQLEIVRDETAAYLHQIRERADRDEADVDLSEMFAAETRLQLTATAGLLVAAFEAGRFDEGSERAERLGVQLDELSLRVREDDLKAAQVLREEIASALEDFAGRLT
jgi:hypothetical protein